MLNRRQFLALVASGVAAEALFPFCDPALHAEFAGEFQDNEVHLKKRYTPESKSYGSGHFGEWISDAQGLPCYHYTCNQTEDPVAVTPVEPAWRAATDQTHQIGNDRLVAAVSNYGYLQVRQDEGGARFLNDYLPEEGLFGAGLGYLTDGKEILGTYYPGAGSSFERFFGMGYVRKQSVGVNFSVDQVIYAPFGDDPVLISEVVISSQSPNSTNLTWAEYWGCKVSPFSYDAFVEGHKVAALGTEVDPHEVTRLRREAGRHFEHHFERIPGIAGLLESKQRRGEAVQTSGAAVQEELAVGLSLDVGALSNQSSSATPGEALPPATFLAALDDGPVRFLTSAASFFGAANLLGHTGPAGPDSVLVPNQLLHPAELANIVPGNGIPQPHAPDDLSTTGPESALILLKPLILKPGESRTLRFVYGYVPKGFSAAELIAKYRAQALELFNKTSAAWKDEGIQLRVESDPWVERETRWHSYYLRSGFTFDDFFGEHVLSQGQVYQYCMGYRGAARDPLQHALPLIFGDSGLARQVLRSTLKSMAGNGSLPFAITGNGLTVPNSTPPSDFNLWLLWLASEYVLATRDAALLEEKISSPLVPGAPAVAAHELLDRGYRYLIADIGTGKHGLLRGLNADWNDQIYFRGIPEGLHEEIGRESESMMNSAMAAYILERYAEMLRYAGDAGAAKDAVNRAAQQRTAVRAQWAGKWFRRLWRGSARGWLGEDRMWLDGQPWAILGQCATLEQQKILVQSIDQLLRKPSRIGAKQVGIPAGVKPLNWAGVMPGETKNGGIYDSLDGPLIWALALNESTNGGAAPGMAWDEWQKNTRAHHAEVYPNVWYGTWSGPDVYCSSDSDHAGQTGYDWGLVDPEDRRRPSNYRGLSWTAWPVMNMHRHAWPLYSASKLLGIEFTEQGIDFAPVIPRPQFSFRSKLVGLEKTPEGYKGWYAPMQAGSWMVRMKLPSDDLAFNRLTVNDTTQPLPTARDSVIEFKGTSTPEKPLRWSLSKG